MTSADRADAHNAEPAVPRPLLLPANQPAQFYRGGPSIAALRGMPAEAATDTASTEFRPEGFVCSVTIAANNLLPTGRLPIAPGIQPPVGVH